MPKKFIKCVKAVSKGIKSGDIQKTYYDKHGKKVKSNPYAICRKATEYYGSSHNIGMIHPHHFKHIHKLKEQLKKEVRIW